MQVLPVAGGWNEVLRQFKSDHVRDMNRYPDRLMILLIDFDGREDRLEVAKAAIPDELAARVFVLGAWSEPEALKANLGPYEIIGSAIAADCRGVTNATWEHELLRHNLGELERLRQRVCPILF
jgi:hypothetical protein